MNGAKRRLVAVIDMQNDFIDGALGTREAQGIVENVRERIQAAHAAGEELVYTRDTHGEDYPETQEGKNLPVPHCIKGSKGWQLIPELADVQRERDARVFEKPTFGSTELVHYLTHANAAEPIESIELIGVCTDICVVSNALLIKAALPEVPVSVDARLCAGVTPDAHEAALATMRSCQVQVAGA